MNKKVIVDSNIIFSSLLKKNNNVRNVLLFSGEFYFYCPRFMTIEIFKHKEKITKLSQLNDDDILDTLYEIVKNLELYNEKLISKESWKKAYDLCNDIDLKDISYVALSIELDALLWTGDTKLKKGLLKKGFNQFISKEEIESENA
jgi:predicted nucleic acid-binding protein